MDPYLFPLNGRVEFVAQYRGPGPSNSGFGALLFLILWGFVSPGLTSLGFKFPPWFLLDLAAEFLWGFKAALGGL